MEGFSCFHNSVQVPTTDVWFQFVFSIIGSTIPVPSGSFIPVFKIGAALGRMMGETMHLWFPQGVHYGNTVAPIIPGNRLVPWPCCVTVVTPTIPAPHHNNSSDFHCSQSVSWCIFTVVWLPKSFVQILQPPGQISWTRVAEWFVGSSQMIALWCVLNIYISKEESVFCPVIWYVLSIFEVASSESDTDHNVVIWKLLDFVFDIQREWHRIFPVYSCLLTVLHIFGTVSDVASTQGKKVARIIFSRRCTWVSIAFSIFSIRNSQFFSLDSSTTWWSFVPHDNCSCLSRTFQIIDVINFLWSLFLKPKSVPFAHKLLFTLYLMCWII